MAKEFKMRKEIRVREFNSAYDYVNKFVRDFDISTRVGLDAMKDETTASLLCREKADDFYILAHHLRFIAGTLEIAALIYKNLVDVKDF